MNEFVLPIVANRNPFVTDLALRTGDLFRFPIYGELGLVEALFCYRLPTAVLGDQTVEVEVVLLLALHKESSIGVALIDKMFARKQIYLCQV